MGEYNSKFNQALLLAQKGQASESLRLFQQMNSLDSQDYCSLVNMGVLLMQQGQISEACNLLLKAVQIDRYQYLSYYNLFLLKWQQILRLRKNNQSEQWLQKNENYRNHIIKTLQYLYSALSCMYAELGENQKDPKLCTKSLSYCQENAMAYAKRAYLYESDGKYKLAENDYSSAIYYDQRNHIFHMLRAEFYWRNQKIPESNQDLKLYWQLKSEPKWSNQANPLQTKEISQQQIQEYQQILSQKSQQIEKLLHRLTLAYAKKQANFEQQIFQRIQQKYFKAQNNKQKIQESESIETKKQKTDEIYADQSSKNISQQIQKLQNQIRLQGGKLAQPSLKGPIPQEQMLLTDQIQKASQQIQNIKQLPAKSPRFSESSTGSRFSQKRISMSEIKNYNKIKLQIVSAQFFDANNKQESKVYISYGKQKNNTDYSKTNFWRQKFELLIEHELHQDFKSALSYDDEFEENEDQNRQEKGLILLQLQMKSRSIWSSKKIIGRGQINIQQMGQNKCILSNQKQKTGIVYFKLKLE